MVPNGLENPFRGSKIFFSTFGGWVGGSDPNVENSTFIFFIFFEYFPKLLVMGRQRADVKAEKEREEGRVAELGEQIYRNFIF